ncbi:Crp/Fnr family transcriptional regulator [Altererythrobacter sp. MF3-039]|uniref:Crp/Fnr family transcriptional regulator n=1 Tax=Altererythrobacter sp. MF3-039 TaxID=3252901 RepID=UPI00390CCFBE
MSEILHSGGRSFRVPMLFSALPAELRDALRAKSALRPFGPGELIQQRGDEAQGFWLIESGSVSVGQFLADGEFRAVALLGPGDSYGELALFAGRPKVVDAVAREKTEARLIRAADMEAALAQNAPAMRSLLGALSAQLQESLDIIAGIRRGTANARVAGMLANLAGASEGPVRLSITQQEIAELLGLTRATVNAALRGIERDGLIKRGYGCLIVLEPRALQVSELN